MSSAISGSYARVHVWLHPVIEKGQDNIRLQKYAPGHVALEIHTGGPDDRMTYISFWPPTGQCCGQAQSHFHKNYEIDWKAEGKKDSETIDLPLDLTQIRKIEAAFEKFKKAPYEWSGRGSSAFKDPYESNCAALVLDLLEQGGLDIDKAPNYVRIAAVVTISSVLILAVCSVFKSIQPLHQAVKNFTSFYRENASLAQGTDEALVAIHTSRKCARNLFETLRKNESKQIVDVVSTLFVNFFDVLSSLHESHILQQESLLPDLNNALQQLKRKVTVACTAFVAPIALTSALVVMNQKIWVKTFTPSDVKKIAIKKQQQLKSGSSNKPWSRVTKVLAIGALSISIFLGKKMIKY